MRLVVALAAFLGVATVACGDSNGGGDLLDLPADVIADTPLDLPPDAPLPDLPADLVPDVPTDLPDDLADAETPAPVCTWAQVPKPAVDPTRSKFALSMFHWNTQYVAGGLLGTFDGQPVNACLINFGEAEPCEGWDDDRLVDWIIRQSFEPVLDMYLAHPTWQTTFECPGIMIEAMEARHPDTLAKLKAGVQSGQIELVSFHWSDQLFLAYPARDLEQSMAINDSIFQRNCLPVSPVVFNQEGMSGLGKHTYMAQHGFTIDVLHENMFRYFQWGTRPWPLYRSRGVTVIAGMEEGLKEGPSVDPASGIEVVWPFFDDGEILATIMGPYLAPMFDADLAAVAAYEAQLQALVDQGYTLSSITRYVADLTARDLEVKDLPAIADSTWQPIDTEGFQQWMGHKGRLDGTWPYERDNDHRTATYRTSQDMATAEVLLGAAQAAGKDVATVRTALDGAWRDLLKAEVTDATGINPWPGEFTYGMTFNASAAQVAAQAYTDLLALLGWPHATVDVGAGTATRLEDLPMPEAPAPATAPFEVTVEAPSRTQDVKWFQAGADRLEMHVTFGPMADPTKTSDVANRRVTVTFPRYDDVLRYTPGLSDREVLEQPLSGFAMQESTEGNGIGKIFLPLPNGLIGLGNDWWIIKHCTFVHLAAVVPVAVGPVDESLPRTVQFMDETAIPGESRTWIFSAFHGSKEQALALANRLNSFPVVNR